MLIILSIILILFIIKLLRDSLFFAWFWQIKEYRVDRIVSHLKNIDSILKNNLFYILILIIFVLYFLFLKNNPLLFKYLILLFFSISFLSIIKEAKNRTSKRPKLTFKIILILFLLFVFYVSVFLYSIILNYTILFNSNFSVTSFLIVYLLLMYLFIPIIITLVALFLNPFFNFQKKRLIKKATEKMKEMRKIKVIGITGSYGKTSTKEFLYTLLNQKYKVIKTEGNNNTNIGVAYTILNKVNNDYDYFICEMGAYKIGEISEICSIVNPEIGILTGINEQHLDLFGSIENTRKAKFELIEMLPENGMAIINKKLKNQNEKLQFKVKNVKYFFLSNIENIKVYQDYVEFEYEDQVFKVNILGQHYIENIISAIMVAEYLGMNLAEIAIAIEKIESTEYMMRKSEGINNSIFIDDSYNANPSGVLAALNYLDEVYKDYKKIIVFPGIIELGKKSKVIHQKLFNKISESCNNAYIMNNDLKNILSETQKRDCKFIFEKDFKKVEKMLKKDLDKNTVVLFESRRAGVVMKNLKIKMENDNIKS